MSILRPSQAAKDAGLVTETGIPRILHSPEHSKSLRSLEGVPFVTAYELLDETADASEELAAAVALALATALRGGDVRHSAWKRAGIFEGVSRRVPATGENTSLFSQRVQGKSK